MQPPALTTACERTDDEPDEELTANLHRLRGDCCWVSGDRQRAATWYGRAILHAYLFHTVGGPPDEYTLQFYVDIRAGVISRLFEVRDGGDLDEAVNWRSRSRDWCGQRSARTAPDWEKLRALLADARKPLPWRRSCALGPGSNRTGPGRLRLSAGVPAPVHDLD